MFCEMKNIPKAYTLSSFSTSKAFEGLIMASLGFAGGLTFLAGFAGNSVICSDFQFLWDFPELLILGLILFASSVYMISEGLFSLGNGGLTPLYCCGDKRVRLGYIRWFSKDDTLFSMAFYDIEPEVRAAAMARLSPEDIIDAYTLARTEDPYLFNEQAEKLIEQAEKKAFHEKINSRKGMLSTDALEQMEEVLLSNPSKESASLIVSRVEDTCLLSRVRGNPGASPWLHSLIDERLKELS